MATAKAKETTVAKEKKPRRTWESVTTALGKDNPLIQHVTKLCGMTTDQKRSHNYTARTVGELCALCKQESVPVSVLPWDDIFGGKLAKHLRLTKDVWIAEWQENQKKNWKEEAASLQSQLDEALNQVAKLENDLREATEEIATLSIRLTEATRLDAFNQLALEKLKSDKEATDQEKQIAELLSSETKEVF